MDGLPIYEGMLKEEMDAAAARHPDVPYEPVLIDATYAGLVSGAADQPLVVPALNRDGDCLSDLVLPMFGSIAGAESVLLGFDENYETQVAMAEAPARHRAGAERQGRREPDGDAAGAAPSCATRPSVATPAPTVPRARSTSRSSRRSPPASRRPISAATPARPSSPTR